MDIPLRNALDELRKAGASKLPRPEVVEKSTNGTKWYGKKKNGSRWFMVKHKTGSYNIEC